MRFSVIIPNYNSEEYIEKCLNSVLNQTFKDFEIIVVDDISSDNSVSKIKSLLRKQDKLIINKTKRLNGGTRNVGILEAKGDYIICLDCDDWITNENIFQEINDNLKDEDIMFLGCQVLFSDRTVDQIPEYNNLIEAFQDVTCAPWTKVVKTKLMKETLFPEGTLYEDRPQHYRLILKAKTYTNFKKITHVWNRLNTHSASVGELYDTYHFNFMGDTYRIMREVGEPYKSILREKLRQEKEFIDSML